MLYKYSQDPKLQTYYKNYTIILSKDIKTAKKTLLQQVIQQIQK